MTKQPITQSEKRYQDSLASLFKPDMASSCDFVFLKSSTDVGVERNGGRNGARFAPQSFLAYFKKLSIVQKLEAKNFGEIEVSSESEERVDFKQAQKKEASRISEFLSGKSPSFICHLGGGHDHIYPLLTALGSKYRKIIVVNIDAHADTRTDTEAHSGTPFRQFSEEYSGSFLLYQTGLLEFANSKSTLTPLKKGMTKILWRHELAEFEKVKAFFQDIARQIDDQTMTIFSLDSDALNGSDMPGVSAVNGNGLTRRELNQIWDLYSKLPNSESKVIGIYELNPVYDTVSNLSMRTLGTFLFDCLKD